MTSQLEVTNASILIYAFPLFSLHGAKIISWTQVALWAQALRMIVLVLEVLCRALLLNL